MSNTKSYNIPVPSSLDASDAEVWRSGFQRAYESELKYAQENATAFEKDKVVAKAARSGWFALSKKHEEEFETKSEAKEDARMSEAPAINPTFPAAMQLADKPELQLRSNLRVARTYASQGKGVMAQEHLNIASSYGKVSATDVKEIQDALDQHRAQPSNTEEVSGTIYRRFFSEDERMKLAKSGKALSDGSFPIVNEGDLKNAIKAVGRAKNRSKAIQHIIKRAQSMDLMSLIPDNWVGKSDATVELPEWWIDRTADRLAEAIEDQELTAKHQLDAQIVRPDEFNSNDWTSMPSTERTLRAQLHRRAVRRNYFQAADDMTLQGWESVPITGKENGELEFRGLIDNVLQRAILVRRANSATWYPKVMGAFASGSTLVRLSESERRFN